MMDKVFDKHTKGLEFIKLPKNLKHYLYIPDPNIKQDHIFLYALIVDYWNKEKGYAHPSIARLALDYGKREKATREDIKALKDVGLLKVERVLGDVNRYIPLEPASQEEVFNRFPAARERYEERRQALERERKRRKQCLADWKEKREQQQEAPDPAGC